MIGKKDLTKKLEWIPDSRSVSGSCFLQDTHIVAVLSMIEERKKIRKMERSTVIWERFVLAFNISIRYDDHMIFVAMTST